jgi:hypothetical protein
MPSKSCDGGLGEKCGYKQPFRRESGIMHYEPLQVSNLLSASSLARTLLLCPWAISISTESIATNSGSRKSIAPVRIVARILKTLLTINRPILSEAETRVVVDNNVLTISRVYVSALPHCSIRTLKPRSSYGVTKCPQFTLHPRNLRG